MHLAGSSFKQCPYCEKNVPASTLTYHVTHECAEAAEYDPGVTGENEPAAAAATPGPVAAAAPAVAPATAPAAAAGSTLTEPEWLKEAAAQFLPPKKAAGAKPVKEPVGLPLGAEDRDVTSSDDDL